jgi:hypothetical protein
MLVVTLAVAYLTFPLAWVMWDLVRPHHFHDRRFSQAAWLDDPDGLHRGAMYDDLVARGLLTTHEPLPFVVDLLGPPDGRRPHRRYWLTGRWHSVSDTCLVTVFDARNRLVRYGLVRLSERAALSFRCGGGVLISSTVR